MGRKQTNLEHDSGRRPIVTGEAGSAAALATAVKRFRAGDDPAAEAICKKILAAEPRHADARHLLGVVMIRRGKTKLAVDFIGEAVAINPDLAEAHVNLGVLLRDLGKAAEAVASCRKAIALRPEYAEAHSNLGVALRDQGNLDEAVAALHKAVALKPKLSEAHLNLGVALYDQGKLEDALAACRRAVKLAPDHAGAHTNLGNMFREVGQFDEAAAAYRRALALNPDLAEAHNNLSIVLKDPGRLDHARRAVALKPNHVELLLNLGNVLLDQEQTDEAVAVYQKVIALRPDDAAVHTLLGSALRARGKLEAALASHRQAIAIDRNCTRAHLGCGTTLMTQGKLEEAIAAFDHALAIDPAYVTARFGRAVVHLLQGNYAPGWRDYLARASTRRASRKFHRDPLDRDLAGKRVVVIKDQGLGDEIFFLRFAPQLKARGVPIIYRGDPRIADMVARIPFIDRLVGPDDDPGSFDLLLSVGDLPYLLGMTDTRDIPPSVEISVLPARSTEMRTRLAGLGPPPYIGLTWRAGTQKLNNLSKIVPMERLAAALRPIGGSIVVIQRNPAAGEIEAFARTLGRAVHDLTALNDDLEGMLALVDLLDDYVCVSNTNFHLRAVRGRVGRVLVPNPPEFRWMAEGEESPWFPGTRVYRQTTDHDWNSAFAALERDLAAAWSTG